MLKEKERADQAADAARASEKTAKANEKKADDENRMARHNLYVAHMNLIQRAWERSDILHVEELLRRQLPQPGQADLREFEWYYYHGMTRHGHHAFTIGGGGDGPWPGIWGWMLAQAVAGYSQKQYDDAYNAARSVEPLTTGVPA